LDLAQASSRLLPDEEMACLEATLRNCCSERILLE
jgi:hypothetical protein